MNIRILKAGLFGLGLIAAASTASAQAPDSVIKIKNHSTWDLHGVYVSPIDKDTWGEDLLDGRVVEAKGGGVEIFDLACGTFDVKLVDEEGAECIVRDVSMCAEEDNWAFDNEDLLACQAASGS